MGCGHIKTTALLYNIIGLWVKERFFLNGFKHHNFQYTTTINKYTCRFRLHTSTTMHCKQNCSRSAYAYSVQNKAVGKATLFAFHTSNFIYYKLTKPCKAFLRKIGSWFQFIPSRAIIFNMKVREAYTTKKTLAFV